MSAHRTVAEPALRLRIADSLTPALVTGTYTITVHQNLTNTAGDAVDEGYLPTESAPTSQQFEVRAPRFTVDPEWIHGCYPPANAIGGFADTLPHVTLTRATLPWERLLASSSATKTCALPWLALLLFGEGELPGDPHCMGTTQPRTVAQMWAAKPEDRHPDDTGVTLPDFDRTEGLAVPETAPVRTISLTDTLLKDLAPGEDELPYLCHLRTVNEEDQHTRSDEIRLGDYAVTVANRFPRPAGGRYVAHLVSLEGWRNHLPDTDGSAKGPAADPEQLRMVSLWSWTFECLPSRAASFTTLTQRFVDSAGSEGGNLLLRIPVATQPLGTDQKEVAVRLNAGYVPITCRSETGLDTFGWYRGPLAAHPLAVPFDPAERRRCAGEALVLLESYGVYDVSLSAAFTAGRAAALAAPHFCAALLRTRTQARRAIADALRGGGLTRLDAKSKLPSAVKADDPTLRPGQARTTLEKLVDKGSDSLLSRLLSNAAQPRQGRPPAPARARAAARAAVTDLTPDLLRRNTTLRGQLRTLLRPPRPTTATGQAGDDTGVADAWLAGLTDLKGLPFSHLVPDSRMLPPESLRFFHVDPYWITALVDGALSIGRAHDFDAAIDDLLFTPQAATQPDTRAAAAGMLLRSELVSGWPGLEITATRTHGDPPVMEQVTVRRRDVLAGDVLLVLFDAVPDQVMLTEPTQGVHFGVDRHPDSDPNEADPLRYGAIALRAVSGDDIGAPLDSWYPDTPGLQHVLRRSLSSPALPDRVADIGALTSALADTDLDQDLSPADFAVQMINGARRRTFHAPAELTAATAAPTDTGSPDDA
ncbi:hypothetical protein AB0L74_30820 [Streptomyces sp. NPDC052020]|uniref:hypothetical protein n=1 Tax=Streptomyces sp. NPDC052020 TaxID=3155677 RepID=UPI003421952D